ncbi:alkaline phosphatase PhoX [Sphingosinicella sp.]|uniref:alkaline phosphatase PhoX n=1 Tax=Sphingosinicella sp. TaxID=1917971 RepID=UPI0040384CEF
MQDLELSGGGYTDGDVDTNLSANTHLSTLIESRYSRRQAISGIGAATAAVFGSSLLAACDEDNEVVDDGTIGAGQNGTTTTGRIVQLIGQTLTGSFGQVSWEQTSGPPVTLTNAGTPNASFIAPAVAAATPLGFRFSARSVATGQVVTADTTVTVGPAVLSFNAVAKSLADIVTVPAGYTVTVLYRGGDPLAANVPAFANDGTDTNFAQRAGDHHDGMYWYGLNAAGTAREDSNNERGLLAMNHENITENYLHPNGQTGNGTTVPRPEAEALKEIEAHGVSVVEVRRQGGTWSYNQASAFNRRITPNTVVEFNGPVRGNAQMRTAFSPGGTQGRGTINNCAFGFVLWGTFLTCEENWAGYFRRSATDNANRSAREITALNRYGIPQGASGSYGWASVTPADATNTTYRRWNISVDPATPAGGTGDYRNEHNHFGWTVECDPYDPTRAPRKRTALGRINREGAWHGQWVAGRKVTIYSGDDARGEYLYKFISANAWNPADAQAADRLAIGDKYLDNGTLCVAKFNADGTGVWLPLVFGQGPLTAASPVFPFQDQADVLIHPRLAADALGATRMDRPEWTATHYLTGEIYLTLTNNNATLRPLNGTDAANPRHYNDPRGATNQFGNPNGHILRLRETGDNSESLTFTWDNYLFGAGSDLNATNINLSSLDATNDFSSPDGIWFARPTNPSGLINPLLWIQTDDGAFTDVTNNQMLAALPGRTGDGGARTITNTGSGGATATQATFVGAVPGVKLKRFMVGPKGCEITGVDSTPDGRTLFVNIQHPGEGGGPTNITSNWPQSQTGQASGRPRSATVAVTKDDGGVVGL